MIPSLQCQRALTTNDRPRRAKQTSTIAPAGQTFEQKHAPRTTGGAGRYTKLGKATRSAGRQYTGVREKNVHSKNLKILKI